MGKYKRIISYILIIGMFIGLFNSALIVDAISEIGKAIDDGKILKNTINYSMGLTYYVNDDGTSCTVSSTGTCSDQSIVIPPFIDGYKVTAICESMLAWGPRGPVKSITIPDTVTTIDIEAFACCDELETIIVDQNNPVYDSRNNCNAIIEKETNTLFIGCKSTVIPDTVISIGEKAFFGCQGLTTISIPNSVTIIGDDAFTDVSITSITIPDSVESIGSRAFARCLKLKSITISESVTYIGDEAFWKCESLTDISIPKNITTINRATFDGCSSLTNITLPDKVDSIGDYAFRDCIQLTSIDIPNGVTTISSETFSGCIGLKDVKIPNGVTTISPGTFFGCTGLKDVKIPNSVTNISGFAFAGCTSLTHIIIPNSVTNIGNAVFYGCDYDIYCESSNIPSEWDSEWSIGYNGTLYLGDKWDYDTNEQPVPSKSDMVSIGDANGDGKINAADANYIAQIIVGTLASVKAADINFDGKINARDSNLITEMITGKYYPIK